MGEVLEAMFALINYLLDVVIEAWFDEMDIIVIIALGIITMCLFMIYKNIRPPSLENLRPQLSIDAIREAEKKVVTELVDAVGEMKEFVLPRKPQRFRKRDRAWFYGRRMLRRVEDNVKFVEDVGMKGKRGGKQMIHNLTKRMFLGESSENSSVADFTESRPAEDWLEEDSEMLKAWVPSELKYILNSFHMFGRFEPSSFAELYPSIESLRITAGQFLFRIGDPDRYIFVVQSGQLDVTTTDQFWNIKYQKSWSWGVPDQSTQFLLMFSRGMQTLTSLCKLRQEWIVLFLGSQWKLSYQYLTRILSC
eukprot:TRINITY_DN15701_c0_g1_i1.p1 TRINITY_DN15701_c0_g1~~TRINITY_DN15701_c0_g1_i1.p1  ORF type:complete len:307 (+),score=69.34 TRINITY_DN15701_c0_g1_i1:596-1516(+)